jgi:hypothetical protein
MHTTVDRDLLLRFFLTFAAFEYALKATGLLKRHPEDPADLPPAEPDWDRFAVSLRGRFDATRAAELREASQYLLDHAPNKQVLLGGVPTWQTPTRAVDVNDVDFLLRMIRCVRNNLFHGGKHNIGEHESTERTERLLRASLTVLATCLALSPEQHEAYATAVL